LFASFKRAAGLNCKCKEVNRTELHLTKTNGGITIGKFMILSKKVKIQPPWYLGVNW